MRTIPSPTSPLAKGPSANRLRHRIVPGWKARKIQIAKEYTTTTSFPSVISRLGTPRWYQVNSLTHQGSRTERKNGGRHLWHTQHVRLASYFDSPVRNSAKIC